MGLEPGAKGLNDDGTLGQSSRRLNREVALARGLYRDGTFAARTDLNRISKK